MMKNFYLKFRISLVTFAFGLASVFLLNGSLKFSDEVYVNLPKVESSSVIEIITKENWEGFQPVGVGCGGRNEYGGESWVSAYRTNEWKNVSISGSSHRNAAETRNEFDLRIKKAFKILEANEKRMIIEIREDKKESVNIISFNNPKSLRIITAPKLETAAEFEQWLNSRQ